MKIKKIFLWIFLIIFVLLIPSFLFFLSNLAFWPWGNYVFANSINKKLEKIFPKNDLLKLKRADYFHKIWEFTKALEKYWEVNCFNNETCLILNHNIWNTYYRYWEFSLDDKKLEYWQKSLSYYSKALDSKFDIETKKNYDFVLEKLNKLIEEMKKKQKESEENKEQKPEPEQNKEDEKIKKQEEQKEQTDKNTKQTEWWQDSQEKQEGNDEEKTEKEQIIPKWESLKIDENSEKLEKPLTKEESEEIEKYLEQLKNEEKQNINLNKPKDNRDVFDILQDDFMFEWFDQNENDW